MLTLRRQLCALGHDARLFSTTARPLDVPIEADDTCVGTTSPFRTLLQCANPWAARSLRTVLDEFRPDVVHVKLFLTQLSPLILPVLRDVPAIYSVADYRPICPTSTRQLPSGRACHEAVGPACYREGCLPLRDWLPVMAQMRLWAEWRGAFDRITVASDWMRQRLAASGLAADLVVPNGVPRRPQRPPLSGPPTVGFAGRLVSTKGVDVLLDAFARVRRTIPDARLLIAGDGPERGALERRATALGVADAVAWTGHVERGALEEVLAPAWVQAAPSTWAEPFGLVAAEAMMRGTAAVVSRSGGLAEIVDDGETGYTVLPSDADALATALVSVLGDRQRAERMGSAGRVRAERLYTDAICVDRFLDLYREVQAAPRVAAHD